MATQQQVSVDASASRIMVFEDVYPFRAAQEQAEKKKLSAFGMAARFNPLNRPRDDTVALLQSEKRLEPFWHISAQRAVDYNCHVTYRVPVPNAYAQFVVVSGQPMEVARQDSQGRVELQVEERCHRRFGYTEFSDGLARDVKDSTFENYLTKYRYTDVAEVANTDMVRPLVPQEAAMQRAKSSLNGEPIAAHEICADILQFERIYLYLRPVFAFEFIWASANRKGVIEVDGLTGEVIEDGTWFKDKLDAVLTRDMIVDIGAEVAGTLVPGGSAAVKIIGKLTETVPARRIHRVSGL